MQLPVALWRDFLVGTQPAGNHAAPVSNKPPPIVAVRLCNSQLMRHSSPRRNTSLGILAVLVDVSNIANPSIVTGHRYDFVISETIRSHPETREPFRPAAERTSGFLYRGASKRRVGTNSIGILANARRTINMSPDTDVEPISEREFIVAGIE